MLFTIATNNQEENTIIRFHFSECTSIAKKKYSSTINGDSKHMRNARSGKIRKMLGVSITADMYIAFNHFMKVFLT